MLSVRFAFPDTHLVVHSRAQAVELPLKVAQTAAVLEVVHSAMGLVRSPVAITGGRGKGTHCRFRWLPVSACAPHVLIFLLDAWA